MTGPEFMSDVPPGGGPENQSGPVDGGAPLEPQNPVEPTPGSGPRFTRQRRLPFDRTPGHPEPNPPAAPESTRPTTPSQEPRFEGFRNEDIQLLMDEGFTIRELQQRQAEMGKNFIPSLREHLKQRRKELGIPEPEAEHSYSPTRIIKGITGGLRQVREAISSGPSTPEPQAAGGAGSPPRPPERPPAPPAPAAPQPDDEHPRVPVQLTEDNIDEVRNRLLKEYADLDEKMRQGTYTEEDIEEIKKKLKMGEGLDPDLVRRIESGEIIPKPIVKDPNMTDEEWEELLENQRKQEEIRRQVVQEAIHLREENHLWNLEYEASPERGKDIIEELMYWQTIFMTGEDQHGNKVEMDWDALNKAYFEQEVHVEAIRMRKPEIYGAPDRPEPKDAKEIKDIDVNNLRYVDKLGLPGPLDPIHSLINSYDDASYQKDRDLFNAQVGAYFTEAHRVGMLDSLDQVLGDLFKGQIRDAIRGGLNFNDAMSMVTDPRHPESTVRQQIDTAVKNWELLWRSGYDMDPNYEMLGKIDKVTLPDGTVVDQFRGIADLYTRLALKRFALAINNGDADGLTQKDYIVDGTGKVQEFELRPALEQERGEQNYWSIEWGRYPKIHAQTVDQYRIAADTYLARLQSVSTSPNELLQGSREFVEAILRSDGFEKVRKEDKDFVINLTDQIRARVGVFGADHTFELYEPKEGKQYLDYTNEDGAGPRRYIELVKSYEGRVMAAVREMDRNPMWDILFSFHGPHGQIARNFTAQSNRENQGVFGLAREALIEQMMGVRLINKDNLGNVSQKMSDRDFNLMFEGLYRYGHVPEGRKMGDANIQAYLDYQQLTEAEQTERRKTLYTGEMDWIQLGRVQLEVRRLRQQVKAGLITLKRGEKIEELLPAKDRIRYERAFEEAEKIVEIAMQMYGAFGEKAKRGGGVFMVQKEGYQDFIPINHAERWVQFGVNKIKMRYADDASIWRNYRDWDDPLSMQIRTDNITRQTEANNNLIEQRRKITEELKKATRGRTRDRLQRQLDLLNRRQLQPINEFKNFKAQYRTAKVNQGRLDLIQELHTNGYDAKLRYDDGTLMTLLVPVEESDDPDDPDADKNANEKLNKVDKDGKEVKYDIWKQDNGKIAVKTLEDINFYTAVGHFLSDFEPNTYWGYQDEHRALILRGKTFEIARAVLRGEIPWQEADAAAIQLLKIDPTLCRVKAFEGTGFVEREGKLMMAAIGDSTVNRLRIRTDLYDAFFPALGNDNHKMDVYYGLQDFGGFLKMTQHIRARMAENPQRFARRGVRLIKDTHNSMEALSDYWGVGGMGITGVINAMDTPLQRFGGTFALGKYGAFVELSNRQYEAIVEGKDQEGNLREALLLKLTNEADMVFQRLKADMPQDESGWTIEAQQEYLEAFRKSLGRLEVYDRLLSLESSIKNAQGMLFIEDLDIFEDGDFIAELQAQMDTLPKITGGAELLRPDKLVRSLKAAADIEKQIQVELAEEFNAEDIDEGPKSRESGLGRFLAKEFNRKFFKLLHDIEANGGAQLYPGEAYFYSHSLDRVVFYDPDHVDKTGRHLVRYTMTVEDWYNGKAIPT